MNKPLLYLTNPQYFKNIIQYHGFDIINNDPGVSQFYLTGHDTYNYLVDMNRCFSSLPKGDIVDRTGVVDMPFNFKVDRPWTPASSNFNKTFTDCMEQRVKELVNTNKKINLFWSGGIDSTAMVISFLRFSNNYSQLRIVYSPFSIKENPSLFIQLRKIPNLELYDYSGEAYLQTLDGLSVSGDAADEITGSLDQSFYEKYGYDGLQQPWENVFYTVNDNPNFFDWTKQYFELSGLEIKTLWQARWWFYIAAKMQHYVAASNANTQKGQEKILGFYDHRDFEHYMSLNVNSLIGKELNNYKLVIKDFIFEFDKNEIYRKFKTKTNSFQMGLYKEKKTILQDTRYLFKLDDNTRIVTDNMPCISEKEYRGKYGDSLNYLFNTK